VCCINSAFPRGGCTVAWEKKKYSARLEGRRREVCGSATVL